MASRRSARQAQSFGRGLLAELPKSRRSFSLGEAPRHKGADERKPTRARPPLPTKPNQTIEIAHRCRSPPIPTGGQTGRGWVVR